MKKRFLFLGLLLLSACAGTAQAPDKIALTAVTFADLPGWNDDNQSEAVPALLRSCAALAKTSKAQFWQEPCAALHNVAPHDDAAARAFFERYFEPYAGSGKDGEDGLFTGYYEPELRGSLKRTKEFYVPLYAHPRDLVTADLGQFSESLKGKHIAGKVEHAKLVPYDDRAAIAGSKLQGRAHVIAWVSDPVDAFFLEIQGSGRLRLPDGRILRVGYDGANGRAYVAIGRELADLDAVERPVTMPKIREWLAEHPARAQGVMNLNPSYVFFRKLNGDGPIGAENAVLAPKRSLAVDPAFVPLGAPVWLDTNDGNGAPLKRLMVAQDTGGAIKGAVRGDVFWGAGKEAETQAGAMQSRGRYYLLLPKGAPPDAQE